MTTTHRDVSVALVTLGCARNDVDSEELAGRLAADGFRLVDDPENAETVVVNTCGFVEAAKKDSVDTLLAAADLKGSGRTQAVVAVGCLAERYGKDLAESLPEADAVLGFDDYPEIAARLRSILAGEALHPHTPRDRRELLPISPTERDASAVSVPGHGVVSAGSTDGIGVHAPASGPRTVRRRLAGGPMAPLKLASGCDRRCSFCAIPGFRGSFVSRRPSDVMADARWLAGEGVREVFLVSENSTSYGKDLGDLRLLETLLPELAAVDGIERVRVSYLQPAETRPGLVEAIATTPGVSRYYDLSFQHASATVLRRMRRFGDPDSFLGLLDQVRALAPTAGVRSERDRRLPRRDRRRPADPLRLPGRRPARRHRRLRLLRRGRHRGGRVRRQARRRRDPGPGRARHRPGRAADLRPGRGAHRRAGRGARRVGRDDGTVAEGRADHQGPEVDGTTRLAAGAHRIGDLVAATVVATEGADLVAEPCA